MLNIIISKIKLIDKKVIINLLKLFLEKIHNFLKVLNS